MAAENGSGDTKVENNTAEETTNVEKVKGETAKTEVDSEKGASDTTIENSAAEESVKIEVDAENGSGDTKVEKLNNTVEETTNQTNVEKVKDESLNSNEELTELEKNVIRQVEYYFGDNNLPRDKFLQEQIKLDDGWVTLTVLLTFKRLSSMTTNQDLIASALLKSANEIIEVSEDRTKIRRNPSKPVPELNEDRRKDVISRTIYAKGFPLDCKLDTVLDFFKTYDFVENVVMRTYLDKPTKKYLFKGSVFATFAKKEQGAAFLALDKVCFGEKELIRMWQEAYHELKKEERTSGRNKRSHKQEPEEKEAFRPPTGSVIHLDGLDEKVTREDIKKVISELGGEVAYVDFAKGDKAGWVRLYKADSAKSILEKMSDAKVTICDVEVSARVLDGDEETKFIDKVVEDMKKRRQNSNRGGKKGRFQGGRGGRGGWNNRKRKAENSGDGPPSKQ